MSWIGIQDKESDCEYHWEIRKTEIGHFVSSGFYLHNAIHLMNIYRFISGLDFMAFMRRRGQDFLVSRWRFCLVLGGYGMWCHFVSNHVFIRLFARSAGS